MGEYAFGADEYVVMKAQDVRRDGGKGRLESFMDEENLADMVGRVFGSFENAFQRKRSEAAPDVAMRCPSCDASLKGRPGSTIPCPYCGSYVTLGAAASNDRLI